MTRTELVEGLADARWRVLEENHGVVAARSPDGVLYRFTACPDSQGRRGYALWDDGWRYVTSAWSPSELAARLRQLSPPSPSSAGR